MPENAWDVAEDERLFDEARELKLRLAFLEDVLKTIDKPLHMVGPHDPKAVQQLKTDILNVRGELNRVHLKFFNTNYVTT